jgi:hypothetical protein
VITAASTNAGVKLPDASADETGRTPEHLGGARIGR